MKNRKWYIITGFLLLLVAIQFIRPNRSVPTVPPGADFMLLANVPAEMGSLIKTACYDCHSYETQYPWYANVAPVSWWIGGHIREGRKHLNFSEWGKYNIERKIHKTEECQDEIHSGHMPEKAYTWLHANARLSEAQRLQMVAWFKELEQNLRSIPPMPLPAPIVQ